MAVRHPVLVALSGGWDEGAGDLCRSDHRTDERNSAAAHDLARSERSGRDLGSAPGGRRIVPSLSGSPAPVYAAVPGNRLVVTGFGPPPPFRAHLVAGSSQRVMGEY